MEERQDGQSVNGEIGDHWWWAAASAAQLGLGVSALRKGCKGDSHFMPFKAFAVASVFVGAAASTAIASLRASGVRSVEDMKALGADVRTRLGLHPRVP